MINGQLNAQCFKSVNQSLKPQFDKFSQFKNIQIQSSSQIRYTVHIKDKAKAFKKINKLIKDTINNLNLIADFDQTLSLCSCPSIFTLFRTSSETSDQLKHSYQSLYDTYFPLENDHSIPRIEKEQIMITWYQKTLQCLVVEQFNKEQLMSIMDQDKLILRQGLSVLLAYCQSINMPFYVISGGLSQPIHSTFQALQTEIYDNLFIFSNQLVFSQSNGDLQDIDAQVLPGKKGNVLDQSMGYEIANNLIVMGDQIADLQVIEKLRNAEENILKIGFLADNKINLIDKYEECYDIVLIGEADLAVVNFIIGESANSQFHNEVNQNEGFESFLTLYKQFNNET